MDKQEPITVVSLFSGCGGMDLGFLGGFEFLGKKYKKQILILFGQTKSTPPPVTPIEKTSASISLKAIFRKPSPTSRKPPMWLSAVSLMRGNLACP
jgi:hypothetical protein